MERFVLNINEITPVPYKRYSNEVIDKIKLFVGRYGQLKPIIINKEGKIIDGNLLYTALKENGVTNVDCIELDVDGNEEVAVKLILTTLVAEIDHIQLSKLISEIVANKHDAQVLNNRIKMTEENIIRYTKLGEVDWKTELIDAENLRTQQTKLFE